MRICLNGGWERNKLEKMWCYEVPCGSNLAASLCVEVIVYFQVPNSSWTSALPVLRSVLKTALNLENLVERLWRTQWSVVTQGQPERAVLSNKSSKFQAWEYQLRMESGESFAYWKSQRCWREEKYTAHFSLCWTCWDNLGWCTGTAMHRPVREEKNNCGASPAPQVVSERWWLEGWACRPELACPVSRLRGINLSKSWNNGLVFKLQAP